ncbi:hypothetical protein B0T10DRAFT_596680 [Thelonectria olida]|uniref:tyrosinase n=1 Tax=Thelonectria olida TaxID=1576542 RepID=A0A9P8W8E4_9HYPO|nr:hypothetical protein B0T10DRAFT_596680 [Thelonectria olida]
MRFLLTRGLQGLLVASLLLNGLLGAFVLGLDQTTYDYGTNINIKSLLKRDGDSSRIVVGKLPLTPNGTLPVRLEIRQMKADTYKWDLFVLSMSMFQSASQDDPMSWYKVAGIHGVPYESWNGVEAIPGANQSGLFTNETERRAYQQAASDFRIPYWDWSLNAPEGEEHFPKVFWDPVVSQHGPNGVQKIRNPLYSYYFHPKDEEAFIWAPLNAWDETKRAPDTAVDSAAPPSRNDQVSQALLSKLPEIQQRLLILLANYNEDINAIGKQAWTPSQNLSQWDSIESIHDIIHIYGGSKGHMTYVPLSSFDPLFLLHHTMTDRLVAMWQLLYPDSWITAAPAGETSYTALKGDMQDSKTALTPFYASNDGTFWDSDMARATEAFGYTYADVDTSFRSEQDVREELAKKVNEWYGASSASGQRRLRFAGGTPEAGDQIFSQERYTDWIAKVRVNDRAVGDNFIVYFLLGATPPQTKDWMLAENVLGSLAVMGPMPGMNPVGREHGPDSGTMVTGVAPLGDGLEKMVAAGEIPGLHPDTVVPFLKERLQVRVVVLNGDNEEVKAGEVAGLHVSICSSEITTAEKAGTGTPKFGEAVERMQMKFWQDDDVVYE